MAEITALGTVLGDINVYAVNGKQKGVFYLEDRSGYNTGEIVKIIKCTVSHKRLKPELVERLIDGEWVSVRGEASIHDMKDDPELHCYISKLVICDYPDSEKLEIDNSGEGIVSNER